MHMRNIFKYKLNEKYIYLPHDFKILDVQMQNNVPCLWADVDTGNMSVCYKVNIGGTGNFVPDGFYVGTVQENEFVWHIYLQKE